VKPVKINFTVTNSGTVDEPRTATIVGMQNGSEVFRSAFDVSDDVGDGTTSYSMEYTPVATGKIMWMAVIDDDNADDDSAIAATQVVSRGRPS